MTDSERRNLYRDALDDPSMRPKFLEYCKRVGEQPKDTSDGLDWELKYLQEQEQRLSSRQTDFCLRYIEATLRKYEFPNLILEQLHNFQDARITPGSYTAIEIGIDVPGINCWPPRNEAKFLSKFHPDEEKVIIKYSRNFFKHGALKFRIINNMLRIFNFNLNSRQWDEISLPNSD